LYKPAEEEKGKERELQDKEELEPRIRGPVSSRAGAALAHPLKRTTSANIESHTLKKIKSDPYFELKFEFYISIQDILHIILFYRLIRKSSSRTYK